MCEKLARSVKPELQEMAFTAGLFSLLDTLMNVSMAYVLEHLPLAVEQGRAPGAGIVLRRLGGVDRPHASYCPTARLTGRISGARTPDSGLLTLPRAAGDA